MNEPLYKGIGIVINGMIHLSPKETFSVSKKGAVVVDVREDYEFAYKKFDVEHIQYIPFSTFFDAYNQLNKNDFLIFADSVGIRSKKAVSFLIQKGFKNIANLNGGIVDWEKDQLPMLINKDEQHSGSCLCTLRKKSKKK